MHSKLGGISREMPADRKWEMVTSDVLRVLFAAWNGQVGDGRLGHTRNESVHNVACRQGSNAGSFTENSGG
jgi:hypothetical protein